ncbi:MAG: hypothetical protein BA867_04750 [Desulfobacterales bacterium S5133MH16]|nr:MAG: hypothetical protein BA867_04750 [Desulfobacterales bacterium S5133MH16]
MIIGTLTLLMLIFGGGGLEFYLTNLKSDVKEHVQDKARQELIIDASEALSSNLQTLEKQIDVHFEDLIAVHTDFHSVATDFDAATAQLKADQKEVSQLILDARDAMHKQMTKDEWEAVFQTSKK